MKTLINKINPQIRISAPEIDTYEEDQMYYIPVVEGHYCIPMCIDDWTLIKEKPKETTLTIDNKLIKKIVKAMFYGGGYTSTYRMSDNNSIHKAFEEFIELLKAKGWHYGVNGEITAPKQMLKVHKSSK